MVQPKGTQPPPPFERWSFREKRYLNFLADQLEVHSALGACIIIIMGDGDQLEGGLF